MLHYKGLRVDGQRVVGGHAAHTHFQGGVNRALYIQRNVSASTGTDRAQIEPVGRQFQRLGAPENIDCFFDLCSYSREIAAIGVRENLSARRSFAVGGFTPRSLAVDGIDELL